jgi:hypothetical protein
MDVSILYAFGRRKEGRRMNWILLDMSIINCENVLIYQERQLINVHEQSLQVVPGK